LSEFQIGGEAMSKPKRGNPDTATRVYGTPHDLAIKAANWAMKDDPACVEAFQIMRAAREELDLATRHEVPKARAAFEAARAEWLRITAMVFDREMAAAGFPEVKEAAE
jgi:hypothetical protein